MNETQEMSASRLAKARARGDADDIAEALAIHANALIQKGEFGAAQFELDEAASIHRARGRVYDDARCTQMSGTLCRFTGRLDEAKQRIERALQLCESQGSVAVSGFAELGEIASAEKRFTDAAKAYGAALAAGGPKTPADRGRVGLLRKRAAALAAAEQYDGAIGDLDAAFDLSVQLGDGSTATRALIEKATALRQGGRVADSEPIVNRAMVLAVEANDHAALADLQLLAVAAAIDRRDIAAALVSAREARAQALAANAPASYLGAVMAIAELTESSGDRLAAYEALAVGWATVSDLLGPDLARASFEPKLREARERWGGPAFAEIKSTYEANRRAARVSTR